MGTNDLIPAAAHEFIPVEATVQMDDIVSVRVASVEAELTRLFEETKMKLEETRKELGAAQKNRDKILKEEVKNSVPQSVDDLRLVLKKAGTKATVIVGECLTIEDDSKVVLILSIKQEDSYHSINWKLRINQSTALKAAIKETKSRQERCTKLAEEMGKLVAARGKLGSVERTARSAVAKQRLSQTTQGRKILTELGALDPSTMLGLPAGTIKI